jgi:hypothetical protein
MTLGNMRSPSLRGSFVICPRCGHETKINVDEAWPDSRAGAVARPAFDQGRQAGRRSDTEPDRAAGQAAGNQATVTEERLSAEQRRALAMLATAGWNGLTQQLLVGCSSGAGTVAALVEQGFATMIREEVQVSGKMLEVARVRITESGSDALASEA